MDPITTGAVETTTNSIKQISLFDPILALLLSILLIIVVALSWALIRQNKTLDDKNLKLYESSKADLQLMIAFGDKIKESTAQLTSLEKVIFEVKSDISNVRSLLEIALKKG